MKKAKPIIRTIRILVFWILIIIFQENLYSQFTSLSFDRISIDQGISNNSINCILQTNDGFIWIATKDGLNRFDGKTFKIFKQNIADSSSLPQNYVMYLFEDSKKNFWIGTWGGGICKFNYENESFKKFNFAEPYDDYIQCIFEDDIGNLWLGTLDGGLNKFNPENSTIINYSTHQKKENYFPANNITFINQLDSTLLIGTWENGLFKLNQKNNNYEQILFNQKLDNPAFGNLIWHILPIVNNDFILSSDAGFIKYNFEKKTSNNFYENEFYRLSLLDSKNRLWIGTYNYHGIYLFDKNRNLNSYSLLLQYSDDDPNTISSNRIRWMYEDKLKNIWVGTEDGLNKLSAAKDFFQYKYFPRKNSKIGGRVVSSIFEGKDNILWVGYGGDGFNKINLLTGETQYFIKQIGNDNSLSASDVVCLYEDSEGNLWIGTSHGGLNIYNPSKNKFEKYLHNPNDSSSIRSNWVQQIMELNKNEILIGTNESLEIFNRNDKKFRRFSQIYSSKIPNKISVNALYQDSKNNIWIGTWLDGLYKYNFTNKQTVHYKPQNENRNSISSSKITSIVEDSEGTMWIGTHSGGLNKLDVSKNKFKHFSTQNGLPNDVVFGILVDEKGLLWISTMKGLVKFNLSTENFRIFDKSDGLINNQFNWRAYFKNKNGRMYFGGINGFIYFDPASIIEDSLTLPVNFISFKVNDIEIHNSHILNKEKNIELDHFQNFFTIEFSVLDFTSINRHQYLYKLEGIDQDWIKTNNNNIASYTDIDPGEYIFYVKASNADGYWSEPSQLRININPAWWMTWWFKIILLIIASIIAFLIYRFRVNQLIEIERIRLNISRDLHDEIGSSLSSISVESQVLMSQEDVPSNVKEQLSVIRKTSVETMNAIRDIIWFINPKEEMNKDLIFKMRETASNLLLGLEWIFENSKESNLTWLNLEAKRNIFLIYKEILNNIVKHSQAKNCTIKINSNSNSFSLEVIDNGVGFDINDLKRKSGIINIQNRAKQINAIINIDSKFNFGTKIILSKIK